MYRKQCVLALLALYLGLAHSFTWDIVVARGIHLEFYKDGSLTYAVMPWPDHLIEWVTYDPFHNRVLFGYDIITSDPAYSFDILHTRVDKLIKKNPFKYEYITALAYDPATELLFGSIDKMIYSFSSKPESNSADDRTLVINLQKGDAGPRDVVVDSCEGYIYWTTYNETNIIERVRFNGSEREVIIDSSDMIRKSLTIDPQKMYWIEYETQNHEFSIESADLNGKNRRTLYREFTANAEYSEPETLAVSKDFIYWGNNNQPFFWQLLKNPPSDKDVKPKQISMDNTTWDRGFRGIDTNYNIEEQLQGIHNCETLKRLLLNYAETNDKASLNVSTDEILLCVHGKKVSGESRCECTQGYSGERCDVSVCHNYCFQGDCSASAEGQPKCRCIFGYSGQRSEVDVCFTCCLKNGACSERAQDVKPLRRLLSKTNFSLFSDKLKFKLISTILLGRQPTC